jgi:hypothetical protein
MRAGSPTPSAMRPPSRRYGPLQGEDPPKRVFCTVTWPESDQSSSDDKKDAFERGNLRGRQRTASHRVSAGLGVTHPFGRLSSVAMGRKV